MDKYIIQSKQTYPRFYNTGFNGEYETVYERHYVRLVGKDRWLKIVRRKDEATVFNFDNARKFVDVNQAYELKKVIDHGHF